MFSELNKNKSRGKSFEVGIAGIIILVVIGSAFWSPKPVPKPKPPIYHMANNPMATTYTVNSLADTNTGSGTSGTLRWCMTQANSNSGSTIVFTGLSGTITLTSSLPAPTVNMTITGPGVNSLTISAANSAYTAITPATSGATVNVSGISFTGQNGSNDICSVSGSATLNVNSCSFFNNVNTGIGGCLLCGSPGNLNATNCSFYNCTGATYSNAIYTVGTSTFTNCTVTNCGTSFPAVALYGGTSSFLNCVIYGNGSAITVFSGTATVTYSCIQGGYTGTGNISTNPQLLNFQQGVLPIGPVSPCNGAGTASGAPSTDERGHTRPSPPSMGSWDTKWGDITLNGYTSNWLSALPVVGGGIQLTWGGAWLSPTAWDVYRGTSSGGETLLVANVTTTNNGSYALFYTDATASAGTTYYYKVTPHGLTTYTNEASATATNTLTIGLPEVLAPPYIALRDGPLTTLIPPRVVMQTPRCPVTLNPPLAVNSPAVIGRGRRSGAFGPGE